MTQAAIIQDPAIMFGKPCVAGTHITVEHILRELSAGLAPDRLSAEYGITREQVAALAYASDHLDTPGRVAP